MNLLNPGVKNIILYNGSNTYTLSGNDISPQSTLTRRSQTRTGARGGYLPFLVEHTLEISLSDASLYDLITSEKYNIFIEKSNGYYVWGESVNIIKDEDLLFDPESEEYPFLIKAKNISEAPQIGQDGNILGTFEDLDNNNIADGWGKAGGTTQVFSEGVQETDETFSYDVDFVYAGGTYTFTLNAESLHANADNLIEIVFLNGSTELDSSSASITTTGSKTTSLVAPSGADNLRVQYVIQNQTGSGTASFSNPKLTIS